MKKQILHIDVNNAFLSWTAIHKLNAGETLDIRTIPAIIGGDEASRKGVVLAKSMKAKECGVVTGEPIYQARKKCPNVQVFQSNHSIYKYYSDEMYKLLLEYTDRIERYSIDECFLDMTHFLQNTTLLDKAKEIKNRIKQELGFTVNVGVAHNKLLAKMASDFTKPDKIHTLYEEEIPSKMWSLPIIDLFMLGKKSVPKLYNMHIKTIGDLAKADESMLIKNFGKHGKLIWEYANGIDNSEVQYKKEKPKCIGNSVTLPMDIIDIRKLEEIVLTLTEQVTYRLRKEKLLAQVVNVQLRTKEFKDFSHQEKLDMATSSTSKVYEQAKKLLNEMYKNKEPIRLVGVRVDSLITKDEVQLSLFVDNNDKQDKLDNIVDNLKEKYGYNMITRAGKLNVDKIVELKEK